MYFDGRWWKAIFLINFHITEKILQIASEYRIFVQLCTSNKKKLPLNRRGKYSNVSRGLKRNLWEFSLLNFRVLSYSYSICMKIFNFFPSSLMNWYIQTVYVVSVFSLLNMSEWWYWCFRSLNHTMAFGVIWHNKNITQHRNIERVTYHSYFSRN